MTPCPKSSALFAFFAQWFTDSFLRTDPNDLRKNTSNHEIDLCQIYGLNASDTALLRHGSGGELKRQFIGGEEYPAYLFELDGRRVKQEFQGLSYIDPVTADFRKPLDPPFTSWSSWDQLFVSGLERGNSTIFYSAINAVFLREHNRLCREMAAQNPDWDDDQLFETARATNIVQLLRVIVKDYINHLSSTQLKLDIEIGFAEKQDWYRTNRICAEFDILYRWHRLVPSSILIDGRPLQNVEFQYNNDLLLTIGVGKALDAIARQSAGKLTLRNTATFLQPADMAAVEKSRYWRLKSYNDYRARFGLSPARSKSLPMMLALRRN